MRKTSFLRTTTANSAILSTSVLLQETSTSKWNSKLDRSSLAVHQPNQSSILLATNFADKRQNAALTAQATVKNLNVKPHGILKKRSRGLEATATEQPHQRRRSYQLEPPHQDRTSHLHNRATSLHQRCDTSMSNFSMGLSESFNNAASRGQSTLRNSKSSRGFIHGTLSPPRSFKRPTMFSTAQGKKEPERLVEQPQSLVLKPEPIELAKLHALVKEEPQQPKLVSEEEKREPIEEQKEDGISSGLKARLERIKKEFYADKKSFMATDLNSILEKKKDQSDTSMVSADCRLSKKNSPRRVKLVTNVREAASSALGFTSSTQQKIEEWPELAEAQLKVSQRTFTDLNTIFKMQTVLLSQDSQTLRSDMNDRERTELLRLAAIINSKLDRSLPESH